MADDELFEMRKKFGVLFQDGALFGSMDLYDNVAFPLRQHTDKGEDEIEDIVMRRLREVGLEGSRDKAPNELSGGMRKRAGFARALVLDPDIVLFDEPDSGLDPVRTALLCELIQEVHAENGGAYVVITHDIMSAKRVAEYIAVLWKGRIVESGPGRRAVRLRQPVRPPVPGGRVAGPAGDGVTRRPRRRRPRARPRRRARRAGCCSSAAAAGPSTRCCSRTPGQLVPDNDVQVGGRRVGSVTVDRAHRRQPGGGQGRASRSRTRRCARAPRRRSG